MKKIINNKVYDTDKARHLGSDGGGDGFNHWTEELYQKRTGEYFLYGEGGPATRYATSIGNNSWSGGNKIIPLTFSKAREWAEDHLNADEYEAIFGIPADDDTLDDLHIQIPAPLMARIRANASTEGQTIAAYVTGVLAGALNV